MGDGFMGKDKEKEKLSEDFETMKEMMSSLFDRVGTVNNRLDVIETAVTRKRLKEAKEALIKRYEQRRDKKERLKKIKAEEKEQENLKRVEKQRLKEEYEKAVRALEE